jgi:hypothetical protein
MIAAAWGAWHSRNGGKLGPGPAFREAIAAAISASPAPSLPTREEIARVLCESRIIYYDSYDRRMRIGLHGDSDVTEKVERLTAAILALFAQPQEKKQGSVEPPPST